MAITATERADILELVVLMFNAAPGATYLADVVAAYEAVDRSIPALAQLLSQTGAFQTVHPNFETAGEFATRFLSTVGLQNDAVARDWVISQFDAGANKAAIIASAWAILSGDKEFDEPQYIAARAMLENKASVADYYSVVLRASSLDLVTLQDVVADVNADPASVDAAIRDLAGEAAQGPFLTPGLDNIQVPGISPTLVSGLVDGNAGNGQSGTYTAGDRIRGNGHTDLELTVIEGGNAGYVRIERINTLDLIAGTDESITFNAAGWTGVGNVRLADGVSGMDVLLNNLEVGTGIAIEDVRGSIAASQRLGDARVYAELANADRGGEGGTYKLFANGDIAAQMADEVSLRIETDGDVALGDVSIEGGSDAGVSLRIEDADDVSVGDITVAMGDDAGIEVVFDDIDGDITAGDIALSAGDESTVSLRLDAPEGDVALGDLTLTAGDESLVSVSLDGPEGSVDLGDLSLGAGNESTVRFSAMDAADLSVGAVGLTAGDDSTVNVALEAGAAGSALVVGDMTLTAGNVSIVGAAVQGYAGIGIGAVTVVAGDESWGTVDLDGEGEDSAVSVGDVSIELGDESLARLSIAPAASIAVGDVTQSAGDASTLTVSAAAHESLAIDAIAQHAGQEATLGATLFVRGGPEASGTLTLGGYEAQAGDASSVDLIVVNEGVAPGATAIGDISAQLGDDSRVMVAISVQGHTEASDDTRPAMGDLTVGNIALAVGDATSIDGQAGANVSIFYGGEGEDAQLGNFTVGDVSLSVGDGFVSGTLENASSATIIAMALSEGGLGNADIGDVTLQGGDFTRLSAMLGGAVSGEDGAEMGDAIFGDLSITGGEAAEIQAGLFWGALAAGSVGDMTVGSITGRGAEDSAFSLMVAHGVAFGAATSVGDLTIGDVHVELGDNSDAMLAIWDRAQYEGTDADANGDLNLGDIHVAVSATTTENLSGRSSVSVSVRKEVRGLTEGEGGGVTVGDVSLAAGAESGVSFALSYSGTMASAGDVQVGTIALSVGDDSEAGSVVRIRNAGGDIGNVSLGGHDLSLGAGASGSSVLVLDLAGGEGNIGNIDMGDIWLDLGEGAEAGVALVLQGLTEDATVGDYTIGDVSIDADEDAVADLGQLGIEAARVGRIMLGDANLDLGKNAQIAYDVAIASGSTVGAVTIGDRHVQAGEGAEASLRVQVEAAGTVGAVNIGELVLDLSAGAVVETGVSVAGTKVAGTTIAGTTATVTDGAAASIAYRIEGDIGLTRVGDIHLAVEDAGALTDDTEDAAEMSGSMQFLVEAMGDANDHLQVGNITIDVAGTAEGDRVLVGLHTAGNLTIGDLTVSGEGVFSFDGDDAGDANTSVLDVSAGGTRTIGNVDFSGYAGDARIDLSWTTAGAASIKGGVGDDTILGNAGANVIEGGKGVDLIDITQGGSDTIVTSKGDSGRAEGSLDTIVGFTAGSVVSGALTGGDKLDFNLVAGSAGNYVERAEDFSSFDEFLTNARDALNSTVRYFVQDDGTDTYVAVNYGSGEADVVIRLAGVSDATVLQYQNFVA